jgi:hypothetical protein
MSKVEKKPQTPQLDYVDQALKSPILVFVTKCERKIEVLEDDVLAYIDATNINANYELSGPYWDPATIETELEPTDAAEYLDNNFEKVTQMYFDQVVTLTMKQASEFMQGYTKSLVMQGLPVDGQAIANITMHVQNEYGIKMEVA